ncbi:MAG: hypothetical protein IKQ32_05600, partial [Prevotella sp.]|nr:hypothetical protein [Prevotella sp.]
ATSGGNKIINANGTLVASTSYTNGSSQWTYDGTETLYAQWEENAGGGDNASWKNNVMTPACF